MRHVAQLASLVAALALLSACTSIGDSASEIGSSFSGGFARNGDTYGTQRRVDVYGGTTAPSLPTIGAPGYGK